MINLTVKGSVIGESDSIFLVGFSDGVIYMANRETIISTFQRKLVRTNTGKC